MKEKKKSRITPILVKTVSIIVLVGSFLFAAYYLFNAFVGKGKLVSDFQLWAKENKFLAFTLYLVLTPLINIIPGISSIFFITLANMMFNDGSVMGLIESFLASFGSVMLSTVLLFYLGRFTGKKALGWIIGKEDLSKAEKILTYGGKAALPFVYLLPFFPDDTMSFLGGMTDMSFIYNFVCAAVFRGIGVFCCCVVGTNFSFYKDFTWWQWLLIAIGIVFLIIVILILVVSYYRYLRKKEEGRHYLLTRGLKIKTNEKESERQR